MVKMRQNLFLLYTFVFIVVALIFVAELVRQNLQNSARVDTANLLHIVSDNSQQALNSWVSDQKITVMTWVNTAEIRKLTQQLLNLPANKKSLSKSPAQKALHKYLLPFLSQSHYNSYTIINRNRTNIASSNEESIGGSSYVANQDVFFHDVMIGQSAVSLPVALNVQVNSNKSQSNAVRSSLYIGAPVLGDAGQVIAVFAFQINTTDVFNEIFQNGRFGISGETYAFDAQARMISNSRFDDELRRKGLIKKFQNGIFNIEIRQPGKTDSGVKNKSIQLKKPPLTRMAESAIAGNSGIDLEGYKDYRGVEVVGAWTWDSQLGIGIATEIDKSEAFKSYYTYKVVVRILTALIVLLLISLLLLLFSHLKHKKTILQMHNSETRFRILLESVAEGIFGVNLDGVCTFINNSGMKLLGYESDKELVGAYIHSKIHHSKLDGSKCLDQNCKINAAYRRGETFYANDEILWRKNGSYFLVEYKSSPVYINGNITGSVVSFSDITARRQAEHALRINEKKYRQMFNAMLDVYAEISMDGIVLEVTPSVYAQTGYTREEILGHHMQEFYAVPGDRDRLLEKLNVEGFINDYEASLIDKNGNARPYSFTGKIVFDNEGKPDKLAGVMRDISNRKKYEDELEKTKHELEIRVKQRTAELQVSNEELRQKVEQQRLAEVALREEHNKQQKILDTVEAIIVELDNRGFISLINRKGCQLLGYDKDELLGKNWFSFCLPQPEGLERIAPIYQKIMAGLLPFIEYQETQILHKNGDRFLIAWHNSHYLDEKGKIIGMLSAGEDITRRVEMEEQARDRQTQLAHMTRINTVGEMATGMAHELNQPLTAIATYSDVAERMIKNNVNRPDELLAVIKSSREQANRAAEIIRHLRQLVNKTTPSKKLVNINEIIKESLNLLSHDLKKHHIKIILLLDNNLPSIKADRIQIEQVLINLVTNSIDSLKRVRIGTRHITVSSELDKINNITVNIVDTGIGVDYTVLSNIFDSFITTKGDSGMGMGLSICRSIIEVHNGKIGFITNVKKGAHFYFTIPVAESLESIDFRQ